MKQHFFDLSIDVDVQERWYLTTPTTADGEQVDDVWAFSSGERIDPPGRLRVPVSRPGSPLDFTSAGVGLTPILSRQVASVFREMAPNDVQLFPVEVDGQAEPYYLLVVARTVRCIEARLWTPEDGRPEKVGRYRAVSGLRIDKSRVGDARVFRLWGWHPALIVDGEIKAALERTGISGGRFDEV
ncbi:imm11 family protein [Cystobacter fuscus]|uniref:imm11 family protein n=1 Tax=Cystobacter fuscus TaxID=43 RepID=UPI002B2A9744|nr:hypothetical protein F0U63_25720 [Cystobacter fuscus]